MNKNPKNPKNKYPKSKNNFQCLGPCFKENTRILHPVTFEYIKADNPFCAVNQWVTEENGEKNYKITDDCNNVSKNINYDDVSLDIFLPTIHFDNTQFLKVNYQLHSFKETIEWANKNKNLIPFNTIKRVLGCSWKAYGLNLKYIHDDIIDLYVYISKTIWIKDIYKRIGKYVYLNNNNIVFKKKENSDTHNQKEKVNFIILKLITPGIISKFLTKYIKQYEKSWDDIVSHSDNIKQEYINYIEKKITSITKK